MKNLSSSILMISFIFFNYIYGFHWMFMLLFLWSILSFEYPVKENLEYLKLQMEETKSRIEGIKWRTELDRTTTQVNLKTIGLLNQRSGR